MKLRTELQLISRPTDRELFRIRVISNLQSVFLSLYALQMQAASYTRPFIFRQRTAAKTIAEQILLEKSSTLLLSFATWSSLLKTIAF